MAFSLAREALPYAAVIGADFAHDWVFIDGDGDPESLAQVTGASVALQGAEVALTLTLGDGLEVISPNVLRMKLEAPSAEAWPAGVYYGGLIINWADGTDEAVLTFAVNRSAVGNARGAGISGGSTTLQRAQNVTRIIRTAAGRLSSIVPQITLTELSWPETTPIGEQVAIAMLDPVGAAVTYSLIDDAGGAVALTPDGLLTVAGNPDALASPTLTIVIEAAVADGDTALRAPFTVTLQYRQRGRLRFNNPENSIWLGII